MAQIPVHDEAGLDPDELSRVAASVQPLRTLGLLLTWGRTATRSGQPTDVVTQDEFTHDVVFEMSEGRYLAFDTT
jgi:hypothetical protein